MSVGRKGPIRSVRTWSLVAATTLALLMVAGTVSAAEQFGATGKRGKFVLPDSAASPAGLCIYDAPGDAITDLDAVEARSPRVFARNRSPRRDGQWIGIRFLFQHSKEDGGNGGWLTAKRTPNYKRFAYDDTVRGAGRQAWQAEYMGTPHFRVIVVLTWYKPGTKSVVQGLTRLRYEWYRTQSFGAIGTEMDRCLPEP